MSEGTKDKRNSGKTTLVIAILAVIIVALAIVVVLLFSKDGTAKKTAKQLSLGEKYLSEQDLPTATPQPTVTSEPTPQPTATPEPTPQLTATPAPTQGASLDSVQEISKASVGDYVTFGSYEQDNNLGNGAEAIEWLVLEKKDGEALLLSRYALDAKPYNEEYVDVTWETCTLRSWLNSEFYRTAFSEKERSSIAETLVRNEDNPEHGTEGGNDTRDKVFLLSLDEVMTYFDADPNAYDPARRVKVTEYAKAQGGWAYSEADKGLYGTMEYDGNGFWWLRSLGCDCYNAAEVDCDGFVSRFGYYVSYDFNVVRPALWIAY